MCRVGYVVVGLDLRPFNRCEKLNRNCRVGYLLVGWALRLCDRREKLAGIVGWDITGMMCFTPV